ncbi:MAG: putative RDD family membrane protein YckC [Verrucomicrobiales bacterium]|jgi:uncharacterized RDD family membrane protein YckC
MSQSSGSDPIVGASFGIRLLAKSIDVAIIFAISCVFSIPQLIETLKTGETDFKKTIEISWWIRIPVNLALLTGVVLMWRYWQTTPGKRICNLKIVDLKTGDRPHPGRLVLRFFGYIISFTPVPILRLMALRNPELEQMERYGPLFQTWLMQIPLLLGFFWILVDRRNRGWHDLISGTVIVRTKKTPPPLPPPISPNPETADA